jgi:hypothetical protein
MKSKGKIREKGRKNLIQCHFCFPKNLILCRDLEIPKIFLAFIFEIIEFFVSFEIGKQFRALKPELGVCL